MLIEDVYNVDCFFILIFEEAFWHGFGSAVLSELTELSQCNCETFILGLYDQSVKTIFLDNNQIEHGVTQAICVTTATTAWKLRISLFTEAL